MSVIQRFQCTCCRYIQWGSQYNILPLMVNKHQEYTSRNTLRSLSETILYDTEKKMADLLSEV